MIDEAVFPGARDVACDPVGIERRGVDIDAPAGLDQLRHDQSDDKRQGRYGLDIKERLDPDPADLT
jgi:hypothetical protein